MKTSKTFRAYVPAKTLILRPGADQYQSIKSVESTATDTYKREKKTYTGDKMLGIATLHKSNAVPVFSTDDAKDISRMRRG